MGRYIGWVADVVPRYPRVIDIGSTGVSSVDVTVDPPAVNVSSAFVHYAEAHIEQVLGSGFTIPFSSNNVTAKDLMIDETFYRTQVFKDDEKSATMREQIDARIKALLSGDAAMITTSGDQLYQSGAMGTIFSTTEDYHPVFGMGDVREFIVDSSQIEAESDARQ